MKIGIIGFGNMGSAIARRIAGSDYEIWVSDKDKKKIGGLKSLHAAERNPDLVSKVEVVVIAVKPQDADWLFREIRPQVKGKLVISIAAGLGTAYIEKALPGARVVRAMPNIAATIGEAVTCISAGTSATEEDLEFAEQLFYAIGVVKKIEEAMINAATAISGSGPGYIFDFINTNSLTPQNIPEHLKHDLMLRLEKAAEAVGFKHQDAVFLAVNTVNSSISLMKTTKLPAAELIKQVASKGGTTEAALAVLHKGGTWEEAAQAALKRAKELAR